MENIDNLDNLDIKKDELIKWKSELETEQQEIIDTQNSLEEEAERLRVRYEVYTKSPEFIREKYSEKSYQELKQKVNEKDEYTKNSNSRLNEIGHILMIIDVLLKY